MANQHAGPTPGPWAAGWGNGLTGPTTPTVEPFCGGRDWKFSPVRRGEETIAVCPQQDNGCAGDYEANARLIAAAPELLAALDGLMELERRGRFMPIGREWDTARAALAKATGAAS